MLHVTCHGLAQTGRTNPHRVRPVDDLDDVLDVDVVLLRVERHGEAVVLPAVHRLVPHRQHLPMHVQHLPDAAAVQLALLLGNVCQFKFNYFKFHFITFLILHRFA